MSAHQWLHDSRPQEVVTTTRLEMLSVLRCAASLARQEGMKATAERLDNDANTLESLLDQGDVTIVVKQ